MTDGGLRVLAVVPALNEGHRIAEKVILRVPREHVDDVLVVDDGSTDDTTEAAREAGALVISHPVNRGVGAGIRSGIEYARREGYDVVVVLNAAGKFDPIAAGDLVEPIRQGRADLVQGSRYVRGGDVHSMPVYRHLATRFYSRTMGALVRRRISDGTSGIRAFLLSLCDDPRIRLDQRWLDAYELEPYLLWKALELGYRVVEVPIEVRYPATDYSRMRSVGDWWRIFRPLIRLRLRLEEPER